MSRVGGSLDKIGKQLAEKFPKATRISIFSRPLNTAPLEEIWCNGETGQLLGMDGERVLGTVDKWKKTVLIEDVKGDKLLKGITRHYFQSCLAVPVLDDAKHVKGVLYLVSDEPNAFNIQGRFAGESIAAQAAPVLEQLNQTGGGEDPKKSPFEMLLTPQALIVALALIVLVGFGLFVSPQKDAEQPGVAGLKANARETAKDLLQHLRVGEFSQAWELFEPNLQRSWSRENFQSSLQAWTANEDHQIVLLNRDLGGVKLEDDKAIAVFFPTSLKGDDGNRWVWTFRLVEDRWRVVSLTGPVAVK